MGKRKIQVAANEEWLDLFERYKALGEEKEMPVDALQELVTLKDSIKGSDPVEYERRKPIAWEQARQVLAELNPEEEVPE